MQHFLEISQLSQQDIESLLKRAQFFKNYKNHTLHRHFSLCNLFYENSTRTRISFEMAAHQLGMPVINFDVQHSSESKGEVIEDTLHTLTAMGITHFALRHVQDGLPQHLATLIKNKAHIINAGDGQHAHPSQALLDLMTIIEQKPRLDTLKIAILGNIRHSRVANSLQCLFKAVGVKELVLIAPAIWQPEKVHYGTVTQDIKEGLSDADVIICLRIQRERLQECEKPDGRIDRDTFALTEKNYTLAKPDVMIMHPGPVNRGVEIDTALVDCSNSYILEQVKNGVYMRMAILEALMQ